jgi:hypothetical protein
LVEGDVRDKADVEKALEGVDVVFHLAAIVSVHFSVKNPLLVNEVNVGGTLNVLGESLKARVKRFVYAFPVQFTVNLLICLSMRSILLSLCLLMVLVSLLLSIIAGFLIRFMTLRPFV